MRAYELVVIVHPDLDETALGEVVERIKGWVTVDGGSIDKVDMWGRRRLAYPIRKQLEGQYVFFQTSMLEKNLVGLERNLRFLEPVMRFLLIAN
ncbi:MAG TPA: 30S ribosomal protein S6 [Anaerolineales bacterium]|nr:30S ribosomal protein S6 [Anaerolineales bacterium]